MEALSSVVAMLVQTCFIFVILGCVVIAPKPPGIPRDQGSSACSFSSSQSSSSSSQSSSYSSSSSSVSSVPVDCYKGKCDRNSTLKKCPNPCPGTCGNPDGVPNCYKACEAYGCECNPGYVVSEENNCVKLEDCPDYLRCNDRNATIKKCPNPCPATCEFPGFVPCDKECKKEGCECKPGFYLNDERKCVQLQDCPGAKACSANETFIFCYGGCPTNNCPENDYLGIIACSPPYPCGSGCSCKADYLRRNDDGRCILFSDCDPIICTRPHEVYSARPPPCLFDKCSDIGKPQQCDRRYPNRPQCICEPGYYRNESDICVPEEQCAKPPPICSQNETLVDCKTVCPPQRCDISYTDYFCLNSTACEQGCDCKPNYLRNASGICIFNEECPPPPVIPNCGENEELSMCAIVCPPQSCARLYTFYSCLENIPCEWGCDCIKGFLRDADGVCIPSEQCPTNPPELCGYNEVISKCKATCPPDSCDSIFTSYLCSNETVCESGCNCIDGHLRNASGICVPSNECFPEQECDTPPECRPTCANPTPNCRLVHLPSNRVGNQDGCQCEAGYVLSDVNGVCTRIEECPDNGCNGDPNAIITPCPWNSPSTCDSPNAGSNGQPCEAFGCQCKPGFILSEEGGECILPEDCKCYPCGANETFSDCNFPCPNQYCPQEDNEGKIACKPGRPCPPGCLCKPYYLKKSYEDETCVRASDCPPLTCIGPNEEWDPCASECLSESCDDRFTKSECYPDPENCQPQCVCIKDHYRNQNGDCVPEEECPKKCDVQQECRPTCKVPNPLNCPFIQPSETNDDSCNCQAGYVLSEVGGSCVEIKDCQTDQSCNGDSHASIKACPLPCPSTCESPNAFPCKRKCDPIGCECDPGYLKSEAGNCVLPDDCEGGNPCGKNETFVACRFQCLTNYCPKDDSRAVVVCENSPFAPCFSGCACKLNHRLLSVDEPRCIKSTDCPSVNCTRKHEKWNSCPSDCGSEYCDAIESPPAVCNTLLLNCNPRCECKKGYYRNDKDVCVSASKCRKLNRLKKLKSQRERIWDLD